MKGLKRRVLPVLAFLVCLAVIGGVGFAGYNQLYGPKAPSQYLELTKDNIQKEVGTKGLVYFYVCTEGRYACDVQREQFAKFADQYGDQVKVAYVNAAEQPELITTLGIQSAMDLPVHFVVRDGKLIGAASGVFSSEELVGLITEMLQNPASSKPAGTTPGGTPAGTDGSVPTQPAAPSK